MAYAGRVSLGDRERPTVSDALCMGGAVIEIPATGKRVAAVAWCVDDQQCSGTICCRPDASQKWSERATR
eukprot:5344335-Prymnesium_polylepis.1